MLKWPKRKKETNEVSHADVNTSLVNKISGAGVVRPRNGLQLRKALVFVILLSSLVGVFFYLSSKSTDNKATVYQPDIQLLNDAEYRSSMQNIKQKVEAKDIDAAKGLYDEAVKKYDVGGQPNIDLLFAKYQIASILQPIPDNKSQREAIAEIWTVASEVPEPRSYFGITAEQIIDIQIGLNNTPGLPAGGVGE